MLNAEVLKKFGPLSKAAGWANVSTPAQWRASVWRVAGPAGCAVATTPDINAHRVPLRRSGSR